MALFCTTHLCINSIKHHESTRTYDSHWDNMHFSVFLVCFSFFFSFNCRLFFCFCFCISNWFLCTFYCYDGSVNSLYICIPCECVVVVVVILQHHLSAAALPLKMCTECLRDSKRMGERSNKCEFHISQRA